MPGTTKETQSLKMEVVDSNGSVIEWIDTGASVKAVAGSLTSVSVNANNQVINA